MAIKLKPDDPDGFIVHSHAGDDDLACKDYVRSKLGLPSWQPHAGTPATNCPDKSIRRMQERVRQASPPAEYVYKLADGTPYLRVTRLPLKEGFPQSHWTGTGWAKDAPKGPKIPYRLPELLGAVHNTVFVVEGEKDVDNLIAAGFVATTNAGGACNWTADLNSYLKGKSVYILPDNDEKGRKHARQVFDNLKSVAASVKIVELPGLPPKGDVSDWIEDGGNINELVNFCERASGTQPLQENSSSESAKDEAPKIQWLDMSNWDQEPVPQRKWAIRDRVPSRQAGLFSGEGGTGKSIIELMKDVAHVAGKDWLGSLPEQGPAFYIGAEDDEDEIHIRLADIARHYGVSFEQLIKDGLHVLPLLGKDATLCSVTRGGKVEVTTLYRQIFEAAGDIKPKNISIDTLSRAFAGNEIDRVQVYAFALHMQALAMAAEGSVTVLSHPSLQGINSGSGLSGSTAWHGAFRFRQYLRSVKEGDEEQPDNDLRQLEFKKNQYGPLGESMVLRYQRGLFLPEAGVSNLDKLARASKAEEVFLQLLRRFSAASRNVGVAPTAPNYAPTAFAKEGEAKKYRLRKVEFEQAMRDLFRAEKIGIEEYGRHSRLSRKLILK